MASTDVAERRAAAAKLLALPPRLAKELARDALLDPDIEVRLYAAQAAASLGVSRAGDMVVEWLSAGDPRLRVAACELIESSPTPKSVQALGRVLSDTRPSVRQAAARAMGNSGSVGVVSPLLGHLDDNSETVRLAVVKALGRIGDRRAVVPLVSKLQDPEVEVRTAAARALGALGDRRAVATLLLALQDPAAVVRVQALEALGQLKAKDATSAIASLLVSKDSASTRVGSLTLDRVQSAALRALGRIGSHRAIKILIEQLAKRSPGSSTSHAQISQGQWMSSSPIGKALVLAGASAVKPLIEALRTTASPRLASGAALALGELKAKEALPEIIGATGRGVVSLEAGLQALADIGDSEALPFVLEHLDSGDARIRHMVIQVAGRLLDPAQPDGRPIDPIRPRVTNIRTPLAERIALARLLGRTGAKRAQTLLLALTKSKEVTLRIATVRALGALALSSPKVDEALVKAIDDPSRNLRLAAAKALSRVGKDAAAKELIRRLGVAAEQDRGAIGIAVSGCLGRSIDVALVGQVKSAITSTAGTARDALIEGLGRMKVEKAGELLAQLARSADVDDRRKVAEALAGHRAQEAALIRLLSDPDPTVRANAVWSLARVGTVRALPSVTKLVADFDVAVAGNAAVAAARIAQRKRTAADSKKQPTVAKVPAVLCAALADYRSYVRANALVGLRFVDARCDGAVVRNLLAHDRSWRVRVAAADLLHHIVAQQPAPAVTTSTSGAATPAPSTDPAPPGPAPTSTAGAETGPAATTPAPAPENKTAAKAARLRELDRRALDRCAAEDIDGTVAAHCRKRRSVPKKHDEVLVYVVPHGHTEPLARAPFALVLANGMMRLGVADRRGALFEIAAPRGQLRLAVPAALAP